MSDSSKNDPSKAQLALQLVAVVPDGTPRDAAPRLERTGEPVASLPAGAALWFDDPDTRYVLH